jgi:serine/threonine protein kinase
MTERQISHYIVGEQIGEGGWGVVYKGFDTSLNRSVALKFLSKSLLLDEAERKRFLREARAASSINHPNVCVVHSIEEVDGEKFIVMELVEGVNLRKWVNEKRAESRSNFLPIRDIIDLSLQVAEGINAAHKKGIVHRDIKPENVMISADGRAKIMDFGLAKRSGESTLTRSGAAVGTVAYMSPEQVQAGEIDVRSDIYSFGILLYELLTGTTPFHADHAVGMMYAIVHTEPRSPIKTRQGVDPELARIVMKCIAKEKGDRYSTMRDVIRDISAFEELNRTASSPVIGRDRMGSTSRAWRVSADFVRKHVVWVMVTAIVGLAVIVVAVSRIGSANGAVLSIVSFPEGSQVSIDGKVVGLTPMSHLRVPAGQIHLQLGLTAYAPVDTIVTLTDNQSAELRIRLTLMEVKQTAPDAQSAAPGRLAQSAVTTPKQLSPTPSTSVKAASIDDVATSLATQFRANARLLQGPLTVLPFTYWDTQLGSDFSRYFKSLLESRLSTTTSWRVLSTGTGDDIQANSDVSHAAYKVTGQYWQLAGRMHFFAQIHDPKTGGAIARAEAEVGIDEMKNQGLAWTPANMTRLLDDAKHIGKPEAESGDLKLELLTNKGSENLLFTDGETLIPYVRVNKPCTVRLFYIAADGTRYVLTQPNDRRIDLSQVDKLVPIDSLKCSSPFGGEILQAVATSGSFEPIKTKLVDGLYVLDEALDTAMVATRGIRKPGHSTPVVERQVRITTVSR